MARTPEAITPSSWRKVIAIATLASVIVSIVILAFTWPTKAMEAKNLPVSIAGPEAAVSQFEQGLKDRGIETFEFKQASSREDAERQIKERETYGAIVFTEGAAPEVMTAPAANASANQMLTGVAQQMNAQVQQKATAAKTQALQKAVQAGGEQGAIAAQQLEQLKTEQENCSRRRLKPPQLCRSARAIPTVWAWRLPHSRLLWAVCLAESSVFTSLKEPCAAS